MEYIPEMLFVTILITLFMEYKLFGILKSRHAEKYKEIGEPSLFWDSSPRTRWATRKFLFKREYKNLNDGSLSFVSEAMLVLYVIELVLFVSMLVVFFKNYSH